MNRVWAAGLALLCLGALPCLGAVAGQPRSAQGVLRGNQEALLSSEMAGKILRIADDGQTFRKGAVLAEFACDEQRAELDLARAAVQGARAQFDNQRRLEALGSSGQLDLALAKAHLAEGQARQRAAEAKVSLCRVEAPYDGIVLKRDARAHESVNVMAPLLRVARRGKLDVVVIAPTAWLPSLRVGMPFSFVAAATGARATGKIVHLGASVDPSSQTFELKGELATDDTADFRPGLAGTVTFGPSS